MMYRPILCGVQANIIWTTGQKLLSVHNSKLISHKIVFFFSSFCIYVVVSFSDNLVPVLYCISGIVCMTVIPYLVCDI